MPVVAGRLVWSSAWTDSNLNFWALGDFRLQNKYHQKPEGAKEIIIFGAALVE